MSSDNAKSGSNFIRDIIEADLKANTHGGNVITRFPPEPNGYMHIGHAKAICIDFGMAALYGGRCHLRFDDTNPVAEDTEYVNGIKEDIKWLGFDWGEHLYFASDFFGDMVELAKGLIRDRKAYVCDLSEEQFREIRGTVTESGSLSPGRDRTVDENLDLFQRMADGEFEDGHCVLRAVGDMASPNMKMRDPPLYRIRNVEHHRTGNDWCIYPMYDYAHPLEDALEGITHSLCSLEFQDNRELYDWVIENTAVTARPRQYEFARLNLTYTVTSKRKLRQLIEEGHVSGWDDPRMPTLRGLRRLGVPPEAIRNFVDRIGVAKTNSIIDIANFEWTVRDTLNTMAPRVMAVLDPLKVIIDNYPEDQVEWLDAPYWPHDIPKEGSRKVPFTKALWVERSDFSETPPKGWRRLQVGVETRLRYGYIIRCTGVEKDAQGQVVAVRAEYDHDTRGGDTPDGRKVKGTIHWVSASEGIKAAVHIYDRLFNVPNPDAAEGSLLDHVNPDSLRIISAFIEPSLHAAQKGSRWQFERTGYFAVDAHDAELRFNRIVELKDSWGSNQAKTTPQSQSDAPSLSVVNPAPGEDEGGRRKRKRKARTEVHSELLKSDPELAIRREKYLTNLQLNAKDAATLTSDRGLSDFFEAAISEGGNIKSIANWTINAVQGWAKDNSLEALCITGPMLKELVDKIDEGVISNKAAKDVFDALSAETGDIATTIERLGVAQISDEASIQVFIDQVIDSNSTQVEQYRSGNQRLFGFFVGAVLKASKGRAAPAIVNRLLKKSL